MKRFMVVFICCLYGTLAFAGSSQVYTDDDLGKYRSEDNVKSSRDETFSKFKEESDRLDREIRERSDKLDREIKELREKSESQQREIESYAPTPISASERKQGISLINSYFRSTLKDPDSLKIYDINGVKHGPYVVYSVDYGAKNSFGGYVREQKTLTYMGNELVRID
jgi:hypothetical protein